jgi:hypothetical protein
VKKGITYYFKNVMERQNPLYVRVFSSRVPRGITGNWKLYAVLLPTGFAPTLRNADTYGQMAVAEFQVVE